MARSGAPMVVLEGFGFRHVTADRPALQEVTLSIRDGEYVGVLGRTGAGVTTLLSALDGVVPQLVRGEAHGRIRVAGRDPLEVPVHDFAGAVGLVFDDPGLASGQATVADEVAFGLENLGVPPGEMGPRITAALEAVGLAGFEERAPASLSGGELQRLAIAGALVCGPPILVLDEPSANLDPAGRRALYGILRRLNRDHGVTVLVSDQDVEGIAADASRVIVLADGRVVVDGSPEDVFGQPATLRALGVRTTGAAALAEALEIPEPVPTSLRAAAGRIRLREPAGSDRGAGGVEAPDRAEPPGALLLTYRDVTFRYPGAPGPAVAVVSMQVRAGEVVGLVGANGSGKSTLLRLANGLLRPERGQVEMDGMRTAAHPVRTLAAHAGLVFGDPAHQLFEATVAAELRLGPRALGRSEAEIDERVRDLAGRLQLDEVMARHPFRLGRGQRKLVALGAVLAMQPRVLLLDEPTTGLDARFEGIVAEQVRMAAAGGAAVLVASHDMAFVARVADRLVVMDGGRILADAPSREVFADAPMLSLTGLEAPAVSQVALAVAARGPSPWPPMTNEEAARVLTGLDGAP